MNKVLLVGRVVRNPQTQVTNSGIKFTRFTIAVDRPISGQQQTDFIPIVAWRNQAEFVDKYILKGSRVAIEGKFTSSNYQNNENQNVTRYEILAERVDSLETKAESEARRSHIPTQEIPTTTEIKFEESDTEVPTDELDQDIPWDFDL